MSFGDDGKWSDDDINQYIHLNLSTNLPEHMVANATLMEKTRILPEELSLQRHTHPKHQEIKKTKELERKEMDMDMEMEVKIYLV